MSDSAITRFRQWWCKKPRASLLCGIGIGVITVMAGEVLIKHHRQDIRFDRLEALREKSEYHDHILNNYLVCMRDEEQPETNCIANVIQLADLNGFHDKIKGVFDDAHIPNR
jgi:hypothetical protein